MSIPIPDGAELEHLYTGCVWAEGPVWLPETGTVRWSDIPNDRILDYDSRSGETRVHREDVEYTNGRTLDRQGRIVQCSHGRRSVEREIDGVPDTLVDRFDGGRFNSPNDVVVAADGAIWFTDPPYGILSDHEGHASDPDYEGCFVFRFDEETGTVTPVITDMTHPNGLAFSPDESVLYVSDTADSQLPEGTRQIRAYDVVDDTCRNGRMFAHIDPGYSDGFRVDVEGRVWTSSDGEVQVLAPTGEKLGSIPVPETVANLCFGGNDGSDLYITATTSLYRIRTTTRQAPRPRV
ncbi:SMP-30/gluconolactonase/LRE family protein [Planctomonas psychrotolerans]|uniref:SMP-30/gluconolactonase/LRE family protein n=1 Tax=Planctomonas psychrotolerans TaxID=2528712 RepID=UPI00123C322C|nr:SMP-30/gluconolactonase/LRE family protein [Planctomonas psychrotolerans]